MKIQITIDTSSSAFELGGTPAFEVARILCEYAVQVEQNENVFGCILRDYNGNTCGTVTTVSD